MPGSAKTQRVHRVVYELAFGLIPRGMCVLHACDTPACCEPSHLRLGSQAANLADMRAKGRDRRAAQGVYQRELAARLRQERGLSQAELGDLVGVRTNTVARWEQGVRTPSQLACERIARALRCQVSDVLVPVQSCENPTPPEAA